MYCSTCGSALNLNASYCSNCGKASENRSPATAETMSKSKTASEQSGLSVASLITGIVGLVIGLFDLSMIGNGVWDLLDPSEIGLLFLLSLTALGLAITATIKKMKLHVPALVVSIISFFVTLACSAYIAAY